VLLVKTAVLNNFQQFAFSFSLIFDGVNLFSGFQFLGILNFDLRPPSFDVVNMFSGFRTLPLADF
jgi:hypothetical protein